MSAIAKALRRFSLLESLSDQDIERLSQQSRMLRYDAGNIILGQDEPTRDVLFIVTGRVRVTAYSVFGREVSYRDLTAGDSFGELSAIDGQTRSATVIAVEEASLVGLPASAFCQLLQERPQVAMAVLRRLAGLVRALSERVFEFSTLSVRKRLHVELLRLARDEGICQGKEVVIPNPLKHVELATRISTHREAITREMGELTRARIIDRSGKTLIIRDVKRLRSLLSDHDGDDSGSDVSST